MNNLFETLDLETVSTCNRRCPTCIRNSHPNRDAVASFFEPNYLDFDIIRRAFDESKELNFTGTLILSHYNEPLMDERLPEILELSKGYPFKAAMFHTNGDFMSAELAKRLDGLVDEIRVTLYMPEPSERAEWITSLFQKTQITILLGVHIPTHFSKTAPELAKKFINNTCTEANRRIAINHRRQYLLCCDDVVGNFGLGTFPEISLRDYWFGERRMKIANDLQNPGGRLQYEYCSTCPRP